MDIRRIHVDIRRIQVDIRRISNILNRHTWGLQYSEDPVYIPTLRRISPSSQIPVSPFSETLTQWVPKGSLTPQESRQTVWEVLYLTWEHPDANMTML